MAGVAVVYSCQMCNKIVFSGPFLLLPLVLFAGLVCAMGAFVDNRAAPTAALVSMNSSFVSFKVIRCSKSFLVTLCEVTFVGFCVAINVLSVPSTC